MQREKGRLLKLQFHWDKRKGRHEANCHVEFRFKRIRSGWGRFECVSICSSEPPNSLRCGQHNCHILERSRSRSGSNDWTTESVNNGYHVPSSLHASHSSRPHTRPPWALHLGALPAPLTFFQRFASTQKLPVGSVFTVFLQALNRGDVGAPHAVHERETVEAVNGLEELRIFKGNSTRAFLKLWST